MRIHSHRDQAIGGGLRSGWSTDEAFTTGTPESVPNTAAIKRTDTKKRQQHTTTVNAHLIRVTKPEPLISSDRHDYRFAPSNPDSRQSVCRCRNGTKISSDVPTEHSTLFNANAHTPKYPASSSPTLSPVCRSGLLPSRTPRLYCPAKHSVRLCPAR